MGDIYRYQVKTQLGTQVYPVLRNQNPAYVLCFDGLSDDLYGQKLAESFINRWWGLGASIDIRVITVY